MKKKFTLFLVVGIILSIAGFIFYVSSARADLTLDDTIASPTVYSGGSAKSASRATFSFGGKVVSTHIPSVICTGGGTGPIMLSSNIGGAVNAVSSQFSDSKGQRIVGGVTGVYKMIPFYATNLKKIPKIGGHILGKADIAPNFSICKIQAGEFSIPFPVRKTSYYGVSKY